MNIISFLKQNKIVTIIVRIFLILTLLSATGLFLIQQTNRRSNQDYIKKMTGYSWPKGTKDVQIVEDNSDIHAFWMISTIAIPKNMIEDTINTGFKKDVSCGRMISQKVLFETYFKKNNEVPTSGNLYCKKDGGKPQPENYYEMLLDADSGRIWIYLNYPD